MRQYLDLLSHIRETIDEAIVDAMGVELGFEDVVLTTAHYNSIDPDELIRDCTVDESQYIYKNWQEAKSDIIHHIGTIKDDEVELGRFIHGILSTLQPTLEMFYSSYSSPFPWLSRDIVSTLFGTCGELKELPWQLREYHEREVDECIAMGALELEPDERIDEIDKRCYQSLKKINKRGDLACYKMCRYFHFLFKYIACTIESTLLEYHCKKDLFAYQVDFDIVLFPSLCAEDIADERNWTKEYVVNLADGYDEFDQYTEFAGYGNVGNKIFFQGVDFVKIPEIDSLLFQLKESREPDYPGHHAQRNYRRFELRCVEMAASGHTTAEKKAWIVSIVQLLGHCYRNFLESENLQQYSIYALSYFACLEAAFIKAANPICVKEICQDLSYDFLLTDPFPADFVKSRNYLSPDEPWEHYMMTRKLRSQFDYQMKRLCKDCRNAVCPFRHHSALQSVVVKENDNTFKSKKLLFRSELRQLCGILAGQKDAKVKKVSGTNAWELKHNGTLYAYIGVVLKDRVQLPRVPWQEMFDILRTECSQNYLKGEGTKIKQIMEKNDFASLPDGYKDVNAALSKLPPASKANAA